MLLDTTGLYVVTSRSSTAKVIRLSTGDFQVWVPGALGLLLDADCILATPRLATTLAALCGDELRVRPSRVSRRATNEAWSYCELAPSTEMVVPNDVPAALASAIKIWRCGTHLIVRDVIEQKLNGPDFSDLFFAPDLWKLINFGATQHP
jgi:hypothetical protein